MLWKFHSIIFRCLAFNIKRKLASVIHGLFSGIILFHAIFEWNFYVFLRIIFIIEYWFNRFKNNLFGKSVKFTSEALVVIFSENSAVSLKKNREWQGYFRSKNSCIDVLRVTRSEQLFFRVSTNGRLYAETGLIVDFIWNDSYKHAHTCIYACKKMYVSIYTHIIRGNSDTKYWESTPIFRRRLSIF